MNRHSTTEPITDPLTTDVPVRRFIKFTKFTKFTLSIARPGQFQCTSSHVVLMVSAFIAGYQDEARRSSLLRFNEGVLPTAHARQGGSADCFALMNDGCPRSVYF